MNVHRSTYLPACLLLAMQATVPAQSSFEEQAIAYAPPRVAIDFSSPTQEQLVQDAADLVRRSAHSAAVAGQSGTTLATSVASATENAVRQALTQWLAHLHTQGVATNKLTPTLLSLADSLMAAVVTSAIESLAAAGETTIDASLIIAAANRGAGAVAASAGIEGTDLFNRLAIAGNRAATLVSQKYPSLTVRLRSPVSAGSLLTLPPPDSADRTSPSGPAGS